MYVKAKRYILKRGIYVANYYIKKKEFESALGRLQNTEELIPNMVRNSAEAQFLIILSKIKTMEDADKPTLLNYYKKKFPASEFIDNLEEL